MADEAEPGVEPGVEPSGSDDEATDPIVASPTEVEAAPLTRADLGRSGPGPERIGLVVLVAAALLMGGFVLGRVSAPGADDAGAATTTAAPVVYPAGDLDRSGYWVFAGITTVVQDSFDRDDGPLGETDTGAAWQVASGTWQIQDGRAAAPDARAQPSIAVVPGGTVDRLTEATLMTVEEGAGIVFRFRDEQNYWAMTADPAGEQWVVARIVGGRYQQVRQVPGTTADETTVGVAQRGTELQVLVDGQEVLRINDPALSSQVLSGLVVPPGSDGTARFDRFLVGDIAVTG